MTARQRELVTSLQSSFPNNASIAALGDTDAAPCDGIVSVDVPAAELLTTMQVLRDDAHFSFEQLSDLCGVDYVAYGQSEWNTDTDDGAGFSRAVDASSSGRLTFQSDISLPTLDRPRFAVVYHLLSVTKNLRLRVRCSANDDEVPVVPSVITIWQSADWFEREAFDLFGILFDGHPDLRRLLTDYGFVGHPFRKDFPLIGNVEVRYDPVRERVVYEPVTIEPRVLVPRVIRDDARYADSVPPTVEEVSQAVSDGN